MDLREAIFPKGGAQAAHGVNGSGNILDALDREHGSTIQTQISLITHQNSDVVCETPLPLGRIVLGRFREAFAITRLSVVGPADHERKVRDRGRQEFRRRSLLPPSAAEPAKLI